MQASPDPKESATSTASQPSERQIDDSVEDTFPASDPPSHGVPGTSSPTDAWPRSTKQEIELWRVVVTDVVDTAFRKPCSMPGRWTTEGTSVVYAADSIATAILEYLAHLDGDPPSPLYLAKATVPGTLTLVAAGLPSTWRSPDYQPEVQAIGDEWADARSSLVLEVPSAVCPGAFNYLVNPMHEDARQLKVDNPTSFDLDRRLVQAKRPDRYWAMGAP